MPVVRPSGVPTTNGHNSIRSPGCYERVLRKRCEIDAHMGMPDFLLSVATNDEAVEWEREKAQRAAALMAERYGPSLNVSSIGLSPGLPPPFDHKWTRGRRFTVSEDDEITLRAFGSWR